jgi:type I restriction enzyme S subunit
MMREVHDKLPPGWVKTTLGEVLEFKYGKSLPAKKRDDTGYPVYGSNGEVGHNSVPLTQGPTLIVGRKGSIGEVHLSNEKCWPIDTTYYIDNLYGQPAEFWLHLLRSLGLSELNRATTLPGLNRNDAYKFSLDIPPLNEQKRIVTRIEELQLHSRRARGTLETVPDLLEQLCQSLLAAAFRGDLTKEWRKKNPNVEPAFELLKRIRAERRKRWEETELEKLKAKGLTGEELDAEFSKRGKQYKEPTPADTTDLPELPETWCWCLLPEVGYMNRGKSRHRPRNAQHLYGGKYPFVQTGDIAQSNGRITSHHQTYSEAGLAQSKLWPEGTVCITIAANIASSAILTYPACFPDSVVGIITDKDLCPPEYVEFFIRTVRSELEQFAPATAQKNINIGILSNVVIPLAPRKEVDEILRFLGLSFANVEVSESELMASQTKLAQFEQAVLGKAFRGELVPQDPNDEPASVLLERIREEKKRKAAERKTTFERGVKMKPKDDKQRNVLTVLQDAKGAMTPEEVFTACGLDEESVGVFYEQLRDAVVAKQIRENRDGHSITLEMVKP